MDWIYNSKFFLLALFLFSTITLCAQNDRLGLGFGIGQTKISEDFNDSYYQDIEGNYWTAGATYYHTLGKSIVDLGGGVHFSHYGIEAMKLNYVKIPLSIDFHFGNRFEITAGGGVSGDLLFASNVQKSTYLSYEDTRETYQFSVFFRGGFTYKLNEKYWLKMLYNYQFGNIAIFEAYRSGSLGYNGTESMYDREQYITLELVRKLGK